MPSSPNKKFISARDLGIIHPNHAGNSMRPEELTSQSAISRSKILLVCPVVWNEATLDLVAIFSLGSLCRQGSWALDHCKFIDTAQGRQLAMTTTDTYLIRGCANQKLPLSSGTREDCQPLLRKVVQYQTCLIASENSFSVERMRRWHHPPLLSTPLYSF